MSLQLQNLGAFLRRRPEVLLWTHPHRENFLPRGQPRTQLISGKKNYPCIPQKTSLAYLKIPFSPLCRSPAVANSFAGISHSLVEETFYLWTSFIFHLCPELANATENACYHQLTLGRSLHFSCFQPFLIALDLLILEFIFFFWIVAGASAIYLKAAELQQSFSRHSCKPFVHLASIRCE